MRDIVTRRAALVLSCLGLSGLLLVGFTLGADHNDPNSANSIFSDIDVSAADLYDLFGFPSDDRTGGENVVVALTFASVPKAGVFDTDMLYRLRFYATERVQRPGQDDRDFESMLEYLKSLKAKYFHPAPAEVRVVADGAGRARVDFVDFVGGSLSRTVDMNRPATVEVPGGRPIKVFIGGRDDAFFNDLPGFFRSINYAPQFYRVPLAAWDLHELPIPKTLLELDGNRLINFDPARPNLGQGEKGTAEELARGPLTLTGAPFRKDANGNFRFVYSGRDAQAGRNVNTVILELPLAFITRATQTDRIVNVWGESWVLKASQKIPTIPDDRRNFFQRLWAWLKRPFATEPSALAMELSRYKLVDTDGQPFADAALNEREDSRQLGADNFSLAPHFLTRLDHLGWGFGPSITALGLRTSFDHGDVKV